MELDKQLVKILSKLRQMRESLTSANTEMRNPHWENYLVQLKTAGIQFQNLIALMAPELRHFVAFPEKYEAIGKDRLPIDQVLCQSDLTEILTEAAVCKEQYREKLGEMGLTGESPADRADILSRRIRDHNDLCKKVIEDVIQRLIKEGDLHANVVPPRQRPVRRVPPPIFTAIMNCDGGKLPVPDDLQ